MVVVEALEVEMQVEVMVEVNFETISILVFNYFLIGGLVIFFSFCLFESLLFCLEYKINYLSYLPGAIALLAIEKIEFGNIFIKKTTIFQVMVGTQTFFPFSVASTACSAIVFASFFKN